MRYGLILDTFHGQKYSDRLEAAIAIAASFACEFQTQDSLLDLMFIGLEAYCFTVGRGVGHTEQMLEILASVQACPQRSFAALPPLVLNRASILSGCISIFLDWDQARVEFVNTLRGLGVPCLVLVITPHQQEPKGPDLLENCYRIGVDRIQEDLNQIQV